jgi:hypothetical protein
LEKRREFHAPLTIKLKQHEKGLPLLHCHDRKESKRSTTQPKGFKWNFGSLPRENCGFNFLPTIPGNYSLTSDHFQGHCEALKRSIYFISTEKVFYAYVLSQPKKKSERRSYDKVLDSSDLTTNQK